MPSKYGFDDEEYDEHDDLLKREKALEFARKCDSKMQDILRDYVLSLNFAWEHGRYKKHIDRVIASDVEINFKPDDPSFFGPVWRVSFKNSQKVSETFNQNLMSLNLRLWFNVFWLYWMTRL